MKEILKSYEEIYKNIDKMMKENPKIVFNYHSEYNKMTKKLKELYNIEEEKAISLTLAFNIYMIETLTK